MEFVHQLVLARFIEDHEITEAGKDPKRPPAEPSAEAGLAVRSD